jgi:hypothetical protein
MKVKKNINKVEGVLEDIKELLGERYGRFSHYQKLPPCVKHKAKNYISGIYTQSQVSLDDARYNWLLDQVQPKNMSVLEIGSNLGYFVLRLSSEFNAMVEAYEPVSSYAKVTSLMAQLCGVNKQVACNARGILKDELKTLSYSDLVVHLNVLHHAGVEYDQKLLLKVGGWENYTIDYLGLLRENSERLFFQTGNISSEGRLFPMEESISYMHSLFQKSGWQVKSVGLIEDFKEMKYRTYENKDLDKIHMTKCFRNSETGLVDYFRHEELCASLHTGLAARPIWYCEKK